MTSMAARLKRLDPDLYRRDAVYHRLVDAIEAAEQIPGVDTGEVVAQVIRELAKHAEAARDSTLEWARKATPRPTILGRPGLGFVDPTTQDARRAAEKMDG